MLEQIETKKKKKMHHYSFSISSFTFMEKVSFREMNGWGLPWNQKHEAGYTSKKFRSSICGMGYIKEAQFL